MLYCYLLKEKEISEAHSYDHDTVYVRTYVCMYVHM